MSTTALANPAAPPVQQRPSPASLAPPVRLDFTTVPGMEGVQRLAKMLAASNLVPEKFQGEPSSEGYCNTVLALEMAIRLNFPPLLVMQNITFIEGKPGWQGKFYIALVNSSTRFRDGDWEWKGKEGSDEFGARYKAIRVSDGKLCIGQWVDVRMAKAEGWWSKIDRSGVERSKWKSLTAQMIVYRSASFWASQWYPEGTLGLATAEELEDVRAEVTLSAPPAQIASPVATLPGPHSLAEPEMETEVASEPPSPPPEEEPVEPEEEDPIAPVRQLIKGRDWKGAMTAIGRLSAGPVKAEAIRIYNAARKAPKE